MQKNHRLYGYLLFSNLIFGSALLIPSLSVKADEIRNTTDNSTSALNLPVTKNTSNVTSSQEVNNISVTVPTTEANASMQVNNLVNSPQPVQNQPEVDNTSTTPLLNTEINSSVVSSEPKLVVADTNSDKTNKVSNGDFSQVKPTSSTTSKWTNKEEATNWSVYIDDKQTKETAPIIQVNANKQLVISSNSDFRGAVTQKVKIDSTKQYRIDFDIETSNRTGQTFLRILETSPDPKQPNRIWLSAMTNETSPYHHLTKIYNPYFNVSEVTLELYCEKGTGKAIFDNISMTEVGPKDDGKPRSVVTVLPEKLFLPLNKKIVFTDTTYSYNINHTDLAEVVNGLLIPKATGQTTIMVTAPDGQLIKEIPLSVLPSTEDNYDKFAKEWIDVTFGNKSFDASDENMLRLFNELETKVASHISTFNTQDDRTSLWNDLKNFSNSPDITGTYRRFEEIAKQIATPTSQFYQSVDAIRIVKEGMAWMNLNVYNPNKDIEGKANWWDYEIGSPRAIVNTLCLLNDYFTMEEIISYTNAIEHFVPDANYFRMTLTNPFAALGGNLVDMGRVKIISGILRKDNQLIAKATTSLNNLFTMVSEGNGFYKDGSYIDHTNVAYTGAYGNVLIDGISQLLPVVQKTDHKIPDDNIKLIYQWIDNSFLPLIVHGELMDMSRGRSISRESGSSHTATIELLRGFLRLADLSDNTQNHVLKSKIKGILQSDKVFDPYKNLLSYSDISAFKQLLADDSIPPYRFETRLNTYNSMDKLAYYNADKDFGFALSLHSDRTQNFEAMNNENTRGWYTGDGMFYYYNDDQAHYSDNYWPTVDPYYMPGTTESDTPRDDVTVKLTDSYNKQKLDSKVLTGQVTNASPFVGSVKLTEEYGLAAMQFSNWNRTISANKGWVILNDKIVFLGSHITNKDNSSNVFTTIDQRKVTPDSPYRVYVNGILADLTDSLEHSFANVHSILLENDNPELNIGYLFMEATELLLKDSYQTGSWYAINQNKTTSTEIKSNRFITIKQSHNSTNNTYAYMMLPKANLDILNKLIHNRQVSVIENTDKLQVVYEKNTNTWAIIKYSNDSYTLNDQLHLTKAGLYMVQKNGIHYHIVSYNPLAQEKDTQTLKVKPNDFKAISIKPIKEIDDLLLIDTHK
ncbi:polysaccharide lyase 8 family protein [Streptococcus pseudoporcinus]|uniref:Hyaluronate lyase n=1 Tax=Streptococcus pseudoporcinus TaxID=361101 RepID=A0A4U9XK95_9STRE|nr:polysaccharide lyase 8 family protein [Streptococcus pseudoporcinus]VTS12701.1 hyaluronate lyase [Streptococcus pseudoporcinus]VUC65403.1 hyaluronate lyase [Streptococcus pseudoporcinus]VUC96290.1 hyaluronate lyase [Streptococcus pseudoporcinus]VUC96684.1 hyaluronate lyase [Streptococcus pseudoporcinus]